MSLVAQQKINIVVDSTRIVDAFSERNGYGGKISVCR